MAVHKPISKRVLEALVTLKNLEEYPQSDSDRDFPPTPAIDETLLTYMRDRGLISFGDNDKPYLTNSGRGLYDVLHNMIIQQVIK